MKECDILGGGQYILRPSYIFSWGQDSPNPHIYTPAQIYELPPIAIPHCLNEPITSLTALCVGWDINELMNVIHEMTFTLDNMPKWYPLTVSYKPQI